MPKNQASEPARMTAGGIYNSAISFHRSADKLAEAKVKVTHPEMPIRFLYFHCIELYLKAFLRLHGFEPAKLQKLGHDPKRLRLEAEGLGFQLGGDERWVLDRMSRDDSVIRARYIETGTFFWPSLEQLSLAAEGLRKTTRAHLKAAGEPVR